MTADPESSDDRARGPKAHGCSARLADPLADWRDPVQAAAEAAMDVPDHFGRLCAALCEACLAPRGVRCHFQADAGLMPADVGRVLSLIVAELVSEAGRQAFRSLRLARVVVTIRRTEGHWVCIVAHNGSRAGDQDLARARRLHALLETLGGELRTHSDPGGAVTCVIAPIGADHLKARH